MATRSLDQLTYGLVDGFDHVYITRKSNGQVIINRKTNRSLTPVSRRDRGFKSSQVYVTGAKTRQLDVGSGLFVDVPIYKPFTETKTFRYVYPGIGYIATGTDSTYNYWYQNTGVIPATRDWVIYYSLSKLVALGLCNDPSALRASFLAQSTEAIKGVLTSGELLNFSDGFNALAFIGELKDLRQLPSLFTKWYRKHQLLSDKALGINFGVLPFASDISSILDRAYKLGPAIDRWNSMAISGKVRNYHRRLSFTPVGDEHKGSKNPYYFKEVVINEIPTGYINQGYPGIQYKIYTRHRVSQEISGLIHLYVLPNVIPSSWIPSLKSAIWGFNKPLSAAWQLVPFSFVVDWFTNIGDIITNFEAEQPKLPLKVVSCGWSYKVVTHHIMSFSKSPDGGDEMGTISTVYTNYERVPVSTSAVLESRKYGSLQFQTINATQGLLGSALLHQRLK